MALLADDDDLGVLVNEDRKAKGLVPSAGIALAGADCSRALDMSAHTHLEVHHPLGRLFLIQMVQTDRLADAESDHLRASERINVTERKREVGRLWVFSNRLLRDHSERE